MTTIRTWETNPFPQHNEMNHLLTAYHTALVHDSILLHSYSASCFLLLGTLGSMISPLYRRHINIAFKIAVYYNSTPCGLTVFLYPD